MGKFIEVPANKMSLLNRKLKYGVGVNDASYMVTRKVGGKQVVCPFYIKWNDMLERCYSERQIEKHPTYRGCSVAKEWLTFTNFRAWMEAQEWQGMDLDKDIVNYGNKIYSADNCRFVTGALNSLLGDNAAKRGLYQQGVCYRKSSGKYEAQVMARGKVTYLGYFKTPEEARVAYVVAKTELIHQAADAHKDPAIAAGLRYYVKMTLSA